MKTQPLCPDKKVIGTSTPALVVSVNERGWPRWTHISIGEEQVGLTEEDVHDLHYATGRVLSFLKRARKYDEHRHGM
jgi:hypothetical protein